MDIHNNGRSYERMIKCVKEADISERNKELILDFNNALLLENLSKGRLMVYLCSLKLIAQKAGRDLDKLDIKDIKEIVGQIQQKDYSPHTKKAYKIIIKRFYKWLLGTKEYPEIVSWIKVGISRCEKSLPSEGELLTEEDVQVLLKNANHPRDKALVAVLWESGARVGEIGNLTLSRVSFDKHGAVFSVSGKTGSRKIRLIFSVPYLSTWINSHPFKDNPQSPLWLNIGNTNQNKSLNYPSINKLLRNLFAKAGIKKKCNPHIFRHSRATFMADHLTEFQMNQYFGWIQGSDMPSTYVHMSGREVDNSILELNGIKVEKKEKECHLIPKICPKCDTINAYDSHQCNKCGGVLDLKTAIEIDNTPAIQERGRADELLKFLLNDDRVREVITDRLRLMGDKFSI